MHKIRDSHPQRKADTVTTTQDLKLIGCALLAMQGIRSVFVIKR